MISVLSFIEPSQEQIMTWLLKEKVELGRMYVSPFRKDTHPTCSFWYSNDGKLYFHDFGTGKMYTPIKAAMELWKVDWVTAKRRLENNYEAIHKIEVDVKPKQQLIFEYIPSKYSGGYWDRYSISQATLERFDVLYARTVYINENVAYRSTPSNPIFIYEFPSKRIKIYRPLSPSKDKKWGGNTNMNDIGGLNCLPKKGVLAFITSSIKDCMVLHEHGFPAVCMQGEGYGSYGESIEVMSSLVKLMRKRFKYVFFFMDSDQPGKDYSRKLEEIHGLRCIFTDREKDISDYQYRYNTRRTRNFLIKAITKAWQKEMLLFQKS